MHSGQRQGVTYDDSPRDFSASRRIVVKVGSAVLAPDGELSARAVDRLAADLAAARLSATSTPRSIVLVSSGAVASGFRTLGLQQPPKTIVHKQAAAAVGQQRLMAAYASALESRGVRVAQVLLTAEDLASRKRFLNARATLMTLLDHGVLPIINENDSVAVDEIKLGDNDNLSALVAGLIRADALVILSSVPGVYDSFAAGRPGRLIRHVAPSVDLSRSVGSDKTAVGTGGMATKLRAAALASRRGIATVVASGLEDSIIARVLSGEPVGTMFAPRTRAISARQGWIGYSAKPKGSFTVDDGARRAILNRGASLLPGGVVEVSGSFDAGAPVDIKGPDRVVFARGLSRYSAADALAIRGKRSTQIAAVLGHFYSEELVHRDDLVLRD
jgi:glutamate 5-kinase